MSTTQWSTKLEIPGRVTFMEGNGELEKVEVNTGWSTAEIYLQGAQVTRFQRKDEEPILFLSQLSRFEEGQPIRGGVPIVFPWFGPREGGPMHGFARNQPWEMREITQGADGAVSLRLMLLNTAEAALLPPFTAEYVVTVGRDLGLELRVTNASPDQDLVIENCLHTYLAVGDIGSVTLTGLKGVEYLDKTENYARKRETSDPIRITGETDRIYLGTPGPVELEDATWSRRIRVEKAGSQSTVLWNPWVNRSQQMPDFGNEEHQRMVCVESGNVSENRITLTPGRTEATKVVLSSESL
jgi:D-hexose-6-phosphate mutarotase